VSRRRNCRVNHGPGIDSVGWHAEIRTIKGASEPRSAASGFHVPAMELDDLAHECQTDPSPGVVPSEPAAERVNGSKIYGKRSLAMPAPLSNTQYR